MNVLHAEIFHVHVGAEANVVGEIPAGMVWILIDHDLVGIPQPVAAEGNVVRRNAKIKAVEPESAGASAAKMPHVPLAETSGEVAMLPGMIDMIVRIVSPRIVTDPAITLHVDVRCVRMTRLLGMTLNGGGGMDRPLICCGPVGRNMATADFGMAFLSESGDREQNEYREQSNELSH